jgi:hypothetical protein
MTVADYGIMNREDTRSDEKRLSHRMPIELWRRVRMEAARRDASTAAMINRLLEERLDELDSDRGQ